jgi:hypothetical protein
MAVIREGGIMRRTLIAAVVLGAGLYAWGCKFNSTGPDSGTGQSVAVRITASPSVSGTMQIGKLSAPLASVAAIESIRVDQATIIIKDISFSPAIDTVHTMDSVETDQHDSDEDHESDSSLRHIHFRGPFVITLQNNQPVQVTLDTIPQGVYDGIRFAIHRLRQKDVDRNPALPDSLVGFSIVLTGTVMDSGGSWTPFIFKTDINQEFKVKGNFVVGPNDTQVPYVLQFDLASWFTDGSGKILDPNNMFDRWKLRWAITTALGGGHIHGGRDADHDGRPD